MTTEDTILKALRSASGAYLDPLLDAAPPRGRPVPGDGRRLGAAGALRRTVLVKTYTMGIGVLPVPAKHRRPTR